MTNGSLRNKQMKRAVIPFLFSVATMTAIFIFSSQTGSDSSELSIRAARLFARLVFFDFESMSINSQTFIVSELHGFIRKAAHFSIYALLGFNIFITLNVIIKKLPVKALMTVAVCAVYASFDETRQLGVHGRSGRFFDVIIDTSGAVFGVAAALIIFSLAFYISSGTDD